MAATVLGCPIDARLDTRIQRMITDLREAPSSVARDEIIQLIIDMTDASFKYHFVRPLKGLGVGFATRTSIDVGLLGAMRVIRTSLSRVVGHLSDDQAVKLADYLDDAYFPDTAEQPPRLE